MIQFDDDEGFEQELEMMMEFKGFKCKSLTVYHRFPASFVNGHFQRTEIHCNGEVGMHYEVAE